jgi:hypothetical protein
MVVEANEAEERYGFVEGTRELKVSVLTTEACENFWRENVREKPRESQMQAK